MVTFAKDALLVMEPGREYTSDDIATRMAAIGRKMTRAEASSAMRSLASRGVIRSSGIIKEGVTGFVLPADDADVETICAPLSAKVTPDRCRIALGRQDLMTDGELRVSMNSIAKNHFRGSK